MPSLLIFPFVVVISICGFSLVLLWTLVEVMTLDPKLTVPLIEQAHNVVGW